MKSMTIPEITFISNIRPTEWLSCNGSMLASLRMGAVWVVSGRIILWERVIETVDETDSSDVYSDITFQANVESTSHESPNKQRPSREWGAAVTDMEIHDSIKPQYKCIVDPQ